MNKNKKFSSENTLVVDVQKHGVITLAQLKHKPINSLNFISLSQAFKEDLIRIEEISDIGEWLNRIIPPLSDNNTNTI